MSHKLSEMKILVVTFIVALCGGGIGASLFAVRAETPSPSLIPVNPSKIIGFKESVNGGYTLIEFMDYQCPPCRASRVKVETIRDLYQGKLNVVVRNLPLRMHNHSLSAAAAAESAREQGRFWPMYDALMTGGPLAPAEIKSIARRIGLDNARFQRSWGGSGKAAAVSDSHLAEALGLKATPSFLLCTPKGQVWHLQRLDQVAPLMAER